MTTSASRPVYELFVGVDIAATTFTAAWLRLTADPSPAVTFQQTPSRFAAFQHELAATGIAPAATLVVLEATSSYWVALAVTLHAAGYQVSVVNSAKVHHYAQSLPRRSKTDGFVGVC